MRDSIIILEGSWRTGELGVEKDEHRLLVKTLPALDLLCFLPCIFLLFRQDLSQFIVCY